MCHINFTKLQSVHAIDKVIKGLPGNDAKPAFADAMMSLLGPELSLIIQGSSSDC